MFWHISGQLRHHAHIPRRRRADEGEHKSSRNSPSEGAGCPDQCSAGISLATASAREFVTNPQQQFWPPSKKVHWMDNCKCLPQAGKWPGLKGSLASQQSEHKEQKTDRHRSNILLTRWSSARPILHTWRHVATSGDTFACHDCSVGGATGP